MTNSGGLLHRGKRRWIGFGAHLYEVLHFSVAMQYCYPGYPRECQCGGIEQKCTQCGKIISDCEWVTNWTSCSACFDGYAYDEQIDAVQHEIDCVERQFPTGS